MSYEVNDFETQVLQRMAKQANWRWELAKVKTEENQERAAAFNIASIPAVKLFVNGEVVD
jgi:putative thioredoxin